MFNKYYMKNIYLSACVFVFFIVGQISPSSADHGQQDLKLLGSWF